jgi:ATP-dependent Zn protease
MMSRRLKATAYHEAGHAVMAIHLKRAIRYVTIEPTDDSLGHILNTPMPKFDPDDEIEPKDFRLVEREILVCLAGGAAEYRLTGRRNHRGAAGDDRNALDLASAVYGSDDVAAKYLEFMYARVRQLIESPPLWIRVEGLAAALLTHKRLNARQAKDAYIEALQQEAARRRDLKS